MEIVEIYFILCREIVDDMEEEKPGVHPPSC